jgi:hypothetical protein
MAPLRLGLEAVCLRDCQKLAGLMIAEVWVLPSLLFVCGRATPLTGLWVTALHSQRRRTVLPPSPRRTRSPRHAMTSARVTVRNSSGRAIPVKRRNFGHRMPVGPARGW